MKLYLRKVFPHDITHEISVKTSIVQEYFENKTEFNCVGVNSKEEGIIKIHSSTDPRFGGDMKKLLLSEGDISENDIIVFKKFSKSDIYYLEILKSSNEDYNTYIKLFKEKDRHVITIIEEKENNTFIKKSTSKTQCIKYVLSTDTYNTKDENVVDLKEFDTYKKFVGTFNSESNKYVPGHLIKTYIKATKELRSDGTKQKCKLILKNANDKNINIKEIFGDFFKLLKRNDKGISSDHLIQIDEKLKSYVEQQGTQIDKEEGIYFPNNLLIESVLDIKNLNENDPFKEFKKYNHIEICIPHQRIFYGAPGTGKSYKLKEQSIIFDDVDRVTFHPSYMYSNFVGCFKPYSTKNENGDQISYEFVAGPLVDVLVKALKNENKNYLLIIEEINRADVASVFGDFFQLLDRDGYGQSEYPIKPSKELKEYLERELKDKIKEIKLPNNLYIWATMNSADQGVKPLDTAFKRRWDFEYISVDENEQEIEEAIFTIGKKEYNWNEIRKNINSKLLECNINEDKLLGTFFISKNTLDKGSEAIKDAIKNKVLMYLYDDAAKMYRSKIFKRKDDKIGIPTFYEILKSFDTGVEHIFDGIRFKIKEVKNEN